MEIYLKWLMSNYTTPYPPVATALYLDMFSIDIYCNRIQSGSHIWELLHLLLESHRFSFSSNYAIYIWIAIESRNFRHYWFQVILESSYNVLAQTFDHSQGLYNCGLTLTGVQSTSNQVQFNILVSLIYCLKYKAKQSI